MVWGIGIDGNIEWWQQFTQNAGPNSTGTTIPTGTWTHIAVTIVHGSTLRFYINGTLVTTTTGNIVNNTESLYIGTQGTCNCNFMNTSLDELRIWNVVRTASEISANMNTELAGTETGLVSYYKFNQGTAGGTNTGLNTLIDVVGCNNGTLTNFALTGTSSNWVAGKPSLTAVADPVIVRPEINVQGNSVSIIDGDVTPSLTDHTSFGNVGSSISLVRTYTIQNTGASTLTISSIVSSGTDAAKFVVSGAPTSVAAGASATFNVTYTPGTAGTHNATITINNTDCDESVYDFAVQGIGVTTSEINLRGNGVDIVRGDLVPTTADHTDFVATGISTAFVRTFTIQNTGGATLNITSINNSNTGDFTVGTFPATIAAGASATFTVTLNSATLGTKNATITINNDDPNESVYDFAITGRVINALPTGVRGNMLSLSGANDVSVPNNAVFEFADGTLEFWIKPTYTSSPGYNPCMISSRNNGGSASDTRYSYHMTGEKTAIELYNGTTVSTWSYTFNTNEWYYVSIVESGTTVEVFVNGISIGTRTTGSSAITGRVFNIGSSGNSERFQGQIDEVRVWNTARTRDQIRENMHLTLSGTESGLVAYYQFNETTGNAVDAVGGNNGTLQNGATRITSEVAIANGTSQRITPSIGLNTFTNANVAINFTTAPADEFIAYQLSGNPVNGVNQLNAGTNTTSCYWIVRQFGTAPVAYNGMNFTLPSSNTISTADIALPSNLKLYKRPDNATTAFPTFFASATSANNTTKVIQFTGFTSQTSFSQFEIGSTSSPLPITLLSFEGRRTDESNVLLQWKTATELNNKGFEIESSENNTSFTKIAFVDGAGNSTNTKNYQRAIENSDDTYYRLKQIDFDGRFSYSNIIFVKGSENKVNIYPNPSNDNINIKTSKEGFVYEIFTLQGGSLIKSNATSNVANVNIKSLPKGVYFVHIIQNNNRVVKKIVVE